MKNFIGVLMVVLMSMGVAFADGQENVPITVSTTAPATYADGTVVRPGEFFALVWVKDAGTAVAFQADGTLSAPAGDAELIAAGPWANKDGWLWPLRGYVIPKALQAKGGELRLLVLDTRKADGSLFSDYSVTAQNDAVLRETEGRASLPVAVSASDAVAGFALDNGKSAIGGVGAIRVASPSVLPPNVPKPEIVATRFEGEGANRKMILTVKKTAWYLQYNAAMGATPETIGGKVAEQVKDGKATADETIEIAVPANGDKGFVKVIRN